LESNAGLEISARERDAFLLHVKFAVDSGCADRVVESVPELRSDEQILSLYHTLRYAFRNGCSDLLFVFINPCSIDVPISCNGVTRLMSGLFD
jgi:hypothetical protein